MISVNSKRLRVALPSSPELDAICEHLRSLGLEVPDMSAPGIHVVDSVLGESEEYSIEAFELFRLAPGDVATYVEHGISHAGITHTDLLKEARADVWRPFTFSYGAYPLVLAAPRGQNFVRHHSRPMIRVATSLPELTRRIFTGRGMQVEVIFVEDSMTACLLGLADGYVDRLVDPDDMVAQGFRVVEVLGQAKLKLVANRGAGASRRRAIQRLIELLEASQPPAPEPLAIPFDEY